MACIDTISYFLANKVIQEPAWLLKEKNIHSERETEMRELPLGFLQDSTLF